MARLSYTAITSLDGYIEDDAGKFGWAKPDEEVHRFANELDRSTGTLLFGRRMYETMVFWEDPHNVAGAPDYIHDYGRLWRDKDKVVFSRGLKSTMSARTRIEREFDPVAIAQLKSDSASGLSIGGAALAAHAFRAGLVDDVQLLIAPVIVGGGKRAFPDRTHQNLELVDERRFSSGFVHLGYRVKIE